jgi:SAM-dependent methyltransferase
MSDQSHHWSAAASEYEAEFIDPYLPDVKSPLPAALAELAGNHVVADLGCGTGPLLPTLAAAFREVIAVDFADGMLARARERCLGITNVEFLKTNLVDLSALRGRVDVAVAVNSLVMPVLADLEAALHQVRAALQPGGQFLGIVPSIDGVHYHTMLLVDRARKAGMPDEQARQNAGQHAEHPLFDFAFGTFRYHGLEQHFWQGFEIPYRLRRAGFRRVRRKRVALSWGQFACGNELKRLPAPWDWFFHAET